MSNGFKFTEEDFDKRNRDKDDSEHIKSIFKEFRVEFLQVLYNDYKYLFDYYEMHNSGDESNFGKWNLYSNPKVASNWDQGKKEYRRNNWMGFAKLTKESDSKLKNKLQIQVYMKYPNGNDFFIGLWLDKNTKNKGVADKIDNNRQEFLDLFSHKYYDYRIKIRNGYGFDKKISDVVSDDLDSVIEEMKRKKHGVIMGKFYSKDEIIELGGKIIPYSIKIVWDLTPIYGYLIGEEYKGPILEIDENNSDVIQLLQNKKQVILYGPPGTGKTFETKGISYLLLNGDIK